MPFTWLELRLLSVFLLDSPAFSEGAHGLSLKVLSGSSPAWGSQVLLPTSNEGVLEEGETASLGIDTKAVGMRAHHKV